MPLRPPAPKDYKLEFSRIGVDGVRAELLRRRWEKEKLAAARLWVENHDAHKWMSQHVGETPRKGPTLRRRLGLFVAIGFGLTFAIATIVQIFLS